MRRLAAERKPSTEEVIDSMASTSTELSEETLTTIVDRVAAKLRRAVTEHPRARFADVPPSTRDDDNDGGAPLDSAGPSGGEQDTAK